MQQQDRTMTEHEIQRLADSQKTIDDLEKQVSVAPRSFLTHYYNSFWIMLMTFASHSLAVSHIITHYTLGCMYMYVPVIMFLNSYTAA